MCDLMVLVETTIWAAISPVDAVEILTVAVAELYGELGLAQAAHAGEGSGLGNCGGVVVVEQGFGQGEQVGLTAGEEGVAREGQAPAGELGAGV